MRCNRTRTDNQRRNTNDDHAASCWYLSISITLEEDLLRLVLVSTPGSLHELCSVLLQQPFSLAA